MIRELSIAKRLSVKLAFGEEVKILRDADSKMRESFYHSATYWKTMWIITITYFPLMNLFKVFELFILIKSHLSAVCITILHNKNGCYFHFITVLVKFSAKQATKARRGSRCITTPSLTSALDGEGWSTPRAGRFTPGKEPVPIV